MVESEGCWTAYRPTVFIIKEVVSFSTINDVKIYDDFQLMEVTH